ncbi:hypothetical protein ACL7TT_13125 [Microbulbifer sp. 2304DJ12-6]|uniref:hypothetical protein n=1 Tax=Microbulbifer sp. 2304DJ12-6 TaxID=3233340 RepID=UPI0039B0D467
MATTNQPDTLLSFKPSNTKIGYSSLAGGAAAKALGGRFKDGFAGGLLSAGARHAMGHFNQKAVQEAAESQEGITYTKLNDRETEQALMVKADMIADGLGAPGGDADWHYSGVESIDCAGTMTYGCTSTTIIRHTDGTKNYISSIEYGHGVASPGTHRIVWRANQTRLMEFKTGLERAVFVTLHERAHVAKPGNTPYSELFANK